MTGVVVILASALAALTVAVGVLWRQVEMLRAVLGAHLRGTLTVVRLRSVMDGVDTVEDLLRRTEEQS